MIPPPTTSRLPGIRRSSSAPVCRRCGIVRDERKLHRLRARGDDGVGEAHGLGAGAVRHCDAEVMRIEEATAALHDGDLARLGHAGEAAGQFGDDLVLMAAQQLERIFGFSYAMPWAPSVAASSMIAATWSSALEGMQPTLRQTPPRVGLRSTRTTFLPRSAARKAAE